MTTKVRLYAHPSRPGVAGHIPTPRANVRVANSPAARAAHALHPPIFTTPASGTKEQIVADAAQRHGVPAEILWGVYGIETGFGTDLKVSSAGAVGHFQFLPSTWASYGHGHSPYNLYWSADAAAHYLSDLHRQFGSWDQALRHYSGGGYGYQQAAAKGNALGPLTAIPSGYNAPSIIPGIGDPVGKDLGGLNAVINPSGDQKPTIQLGDILGKFISKEVWLSLGKLVLGAALLLMALHMAFSSMGGGKGKVHKAVTKVMK